MNMRAGSLLPCLLAAALCGCVGGTLGDHRGIEMLPLRAASDDEGKYLKSCLQSAQREQLRHRQKTGKFARKIHDLPVGRECRDFLLSQAGTKTGYEIRAELREDESEVLWSVNEKGVIEEHMDPDADLDLEF
jgi:hypothetical protein